MPPPNGRARSGARPSLTLVARYAPAWTQSDIYPTTIVGRIVGIALMLVGIGFLAVLTATVASRFVKADRAEETSEILETLRRLEADIAELKARPQAP